jgi:superfamily I DNA/RNA helicase/RecB family exonuclease
VPSSATARLVRSSAPSAPPITPDEDQQRVIDYRPGPLLVLAGPGTGKTATVVELIADRVERHGLTPEQTLVLTFSRRAADELRVRLASRLNTTVQGRLAWTFHAWCYSVLRSFDPTISGDALRLLSGPEQDVVVRELLNPKRGKPDEHWGAEWLPFLKLRGFADEVRGLLARCQERGFDPVDLDRLGRETSRPAWQALAPFFNDYLANLDWQGAVDYSGLVQRTARLLAAPEVVSEVAKDLRLIVVDEYQDTDPAQEQVLQALAGTGAQLVVVGDPDQSIYAFRGADVSGILEFPQRFRGPRGRPGKVMALGRSRRSGAELVAASRSVAARLPLPGLPVEAVTSHRRLEALGPAASAPVAIRVFASPAQEAVAIADVLRRAHLIDGVPWAAMAILVRSTRLAGPLQRALADAGVPVETPADELPLVREPALDPLLTMLRVGVGDCPLDEETAIALLCSPLGGADALDVRRLRRALHLAERAAGGIRRSGDLIVHCLLAEASEPEAAVHLPEEIGEAAQRISRLLVLVRTAAASGQTPEEVLWSVWSASRWRRQLEEVANRQGPATSAMLRHADRQLDAVVALFEAAARFTDRLPGSGLEVFLRGLVDQEIPADPLSQRGFSGDAVRLLTAHRSKGLEWDLVIVAGVQEGVWPDLRRRGTLLEGDAIAGADEEPTLFAAQEASAAARSQALVDERRLFYVAVTRARRRLVVTAVSGGDETELRPSRFLSELGVALPDTIETAPRVLSLPALVAELRCVASDPEASPALRTAAVEELALLAPTVPAADPQRWWGLAEWTERTLPLLPVDGAVTLSPSQVEAIQTCPLRWFLVRRAGAATAATSSQGFGTLVHDIAREIVDAGIENLPELEQRLDLHWPQIDWEAPWYSVREHAAARAALARLLEWHTGRGNTVIGAELDFDLELELPTGRARIRGQIDRLERDPEGRGVVVDYKTGRQPPTADEVTQSPQLGLYQLAVEHGAVQTPDAAELKGTGGAALFHLRKGKEQEQPQLIIEDDGRTWIHGLLEDLVATIAAERFPARPNSGCDNCAVRRSCPARPEGMQVA